jgi:hypothetical protein
MKPHVMIDLETVSTQSNATILTFAAMKFDPHGDAREVSSDRIFNSNQSFYRRVDPESCSDLGGHIDDSTVAWWSKQSEEVKEEAFHPDDRHSIKDVLVDFHRWYADSEAAWSNGSIFDINIIEYYNKELHRGNPWKFWEIRDTRTVYGLTDAELPDLGVNAHHALMDCWKQVVGVQNVYRKLGI